MAASQFQGPLVSFGGLADPTATIGAGVAHPGPSLLYQGSAALLPNWLYPKDQAGGYKGVAPALWASDAYRSAVGTPAAHVADNIAAAANAASGVAMTLAVPSFGAAANVPIYTSAATGNSTNGGTLVTPKLCLDFGFCLATLVSGSANVTFADTSVLVPGMPLVFAAIATTTTPWLTSVQSITSATVAVMSSNAPFSAATGGARVGTGNIWQSNEGIYAVPTAAAPFMAAGPGLFLDARQAISRGVVITGVSGGAGGAFTVRGYDVYGQAMAETITATTGATAAYGVKAFKYISSVTPAFTDAHNYTVGTSDIFGFNTRASQIEDTEIWWNGLLNAASTGFVAGLAAGTASTATTADVRGTILVSNVGGSGIGTTVSNGSHSGTAFTGVILSMTVRNALRDMILSNATTAASLLGNAQFSS